MTFLLPTCTDPSPTPCISACMDFLNVVIAAVRVMLLWMISHLLNCSLTELLQYLSRNVILISQSQEIWLLL